MIPQFALRLICGLATLWTIAPRRDITSGYFRIQMLIALGLGVLTAVTASQSVTGPSPTSDINSSLVFACGMVIAGLAFMGSILWTLERRAAGGTLGALIMILAAAAVVLTSAYVTPGGQRSWLGMADGMTSAWLIGSVTGTMLLGHWYLTATGMKLNPLIRYNRWFLAAVVLRIIVAGILTATRWPYDAQHWTLSILRWGGLLGPLVMGVLTIQILKFRNTQSATGVLYAATTLVFMGEMAAALAARAGEIPPGI